MKNEIQNKQENNIEQKEELQIKTGFARHAFFSGVYYMNLLKKTIFCARRNRDFTKEIDDRDIYQELTACYERSIQNQKEYCENLMKNQENLHEYHKMLMANQEQYYENTKESQKKMYEKIINMNQNNYETYRHLDTVYWKDRVDALGKNVEEKQHQIDEDRLKIVHLEVKVSRLQSEVNHAHNPNNLNLQHDLIKSLRGIISEQEQEYRELKNIMFENSKFTL